MGMWGGGFIQVSTVPTEIRKEPPGAVILCSVSPEVWL